MSKHTKWVASATLATTLLASACLSNLSFAATTQYVETNHGWVSYHSQPSTSSATLGRLTLGEKAPLISKYNSYWYKIQVNGKSVYITTSSNYTHLASGTSTTPTASLAPVQAPTQAPKPSSTPAPSPAPTPVQSSGTGTSTASSTLTAQQQKLMTVAKSQIGVPYLWGRQLPGVGFDCSNFTSWVYKDALGIHFSSSSRSQRYDSSIGTPVPMNKNDKLANLQVGDILFFANSADPGDGTVGQASSGGGGHVGLYAGNGMVIQEGGGRAKVTYEKMQGTWFLTKLVFAKRIL